MGSDEKIQNTAKFSKKTPTVLLFIFLIVEKKKILFYTMLNRLLPVGRFLPVQVQGNICKALKRGLTKRKNI